MEPTPPPFNKPQPTYRPISVYRRGADNGVGMGAYLTALFLCSTFTVYYPILSLVALVMFIFTPVLLYRFLMRSWRADHGMSEFSALWLEGIITFVCGTLIMGAAGWIIIRLTHPNYVVEAFEICADAYRQIGTPEAEDFAKLIDGGVKQHLIPTTAQLVIEMMLLGVFSGSLLSAIITFLVRMKKVN